MNKAVLLYLILVLATATQAVAGVVEDAEEQIKKLRKENRGHTQPHAVQNYPAPAPTSGKAATASGRASDTATRGESGVSSGSVGNSIGAASSGDLDSGEKPTRRRGSKPRDKGDKLLSIFGILVLLLLIGAGTLFGKRRESAR